MRSGNSSNSMTTPVRIGLFGIGKSNSRYRFRIGARRFVNEWNGHSPAHHCAAGIGHIAHKLGKLGKFLGVETVQVC
jgi:L-arabinose isomerase